MAKDLEAGKVYIDSDRSCIFRCSRIRKRLEEVTVCFVEKQHIEFPIESYRSGVVTHWSHKFREADEMALMKGLKAKEIAEATIRAILQVNAAKDGCDDDT